MKSVVRLCNKFKTRKMEKFTEGNWQAHGSDHSRRITVKSGKKLICAINPSDEDWNNATLISASKDLLEALEAARIKLISSYGLERPEHLELLFGQINHAINKANGKL